MKSIKNKVIVITGAGSGIGRALAELCAAEGALLALNDFNKESLAETVSIVKNLCKDVFFRDFDVSKKEDFHQFADDVIEYFGHVDVVINNAGVALGKLTLEEVTMITVLKTILSTVNCTTGMRWMPATYVRQVGGFPLMMIGQSSWAIWAAMKA